MPFLALTNRLLSRKNGISNYAEEDSLRPVIILGMHRSGTSALSGAVQRLGVYFGESGELFQGDKWNQNGYYEFAKLVQLNDELLASVGSAWDAPPSRKERKKLIYASPALLERAHEICRGLQLRAREKGQPWGFKDPRTTLTWQFWKRVIPKPRVIISIRAPLDVAASLSLRHQLTMQFGLRLCNSYLEALLETTKEDDVLVVQYPQLIERPFDTLLTISNWADLHISDQDLESAAQSIRPELNHNRMSNLQPSDGLEKILRNHFLNKRNSR